MHAVRRMAFLSIATSLATIVLKFSAYFLTGSVSLWSDALESLVNLAAGLVALGAHHAGRAAGRRPARVRTRQGRVFLERRRGRADPRRRRGDHLVGRPAADRAAAPGAARPRHPGGIPRGRGELRHRARDAEGRAPARQHHDRGRREAPHDRRVDVGRHSRGARRRDGAAGVGDPRPADGDRGRRSHRRHRHRPAAAFGRRSHGRRAAAGGSPARRDADPRRTAGRRELTTPCARASPARGASSIFTCWCRAP